MTSLEAPTASRFYSRLATMNDLEQVVDLGERAFIRDPLWNYFGNLKEYLDIEKPAKGRQGLRTFTSFIFKSALYIGGRVIVMLDKESKDGKGHEKVVSIALWHPPKKRLSPWKVLAITRGGVFSVLSKWGVTGFLRIVVEYSDKIHETLASGFKQKGMKAEDADNAAWYLQLTMTDPDYQGQGLMSRLMREGFEHAPNATFSLEATTAHSRDCYQHLGFEVIDVVKFGEGKADAGGLVASGDKAVGVECWPMIKVKGS
ncbi:hypothetical protein BJ165DRAFT_1435859 [Panaeolus papilionaceus]|nr:hypothetical protein BJ165DRAFT_1435859 [Panaeolus papilionaceus]